MQVEQTQEQIDAAKRKEEKKQPQQRPRNISPNIIGNAEVPD